jgi:hypothetical protein
MLNSGKTFRLTVLSADCPAQSSIHRYAVILEPIFHRNITFGTMYTIINI